MGKYHFNILLLFILCLSSTVSFASNVDSLKNLLSHAANDDVKARLLNEISWAYNRTDIELTKQYANRALELAKFTSNRREEARALNLLGIVASSQGAIDLSIKYNEQALEIGETIKDDFIIGVATNDLGISYVQRGNDELALQYYHRSLEIARASNDLLGISFTLSNIGLLHYNKGNEEQALEYFEGAAEIGQQSKDPMVLADAYSNLSGLYYDKEEYDLALKYEVKALDIALKSGNRLNAAYSLMYIGDMQYEKGFEEIAEQSYARALREARDLDDKYLITNVYLQTANLYHIQGKNNDALTLGRMALQMSEDYDVGDLVPNIHATLAQIYATNKDFERAFKHSELYNETADSIYRVENQRVVAELETLYNTNETLEENELLIAQNIRNKKLIRQRTVIMVISILALILLILLSYSMWRNYRIRKTSLDTLTSKVKERTEELENSNQSLRQTNSALERFTYIASHDLREPLRNIKSFSDLLQKSTIQGDKKRSLEYLKFIQSGSKRMFALVEAIQDVTHYRKTTPQYEYIDTYKVIQSVTEDLAQVIEENNAVINFCEMPFVKADKALLGIVFQNLIKNAIKYNESDPKMVELSYSETFKEYTFAISDNGIGINKEYHNKVFDAFKRLHHYENVDGAGIGMFISRDIVEMHNGKIWIEENYPSGSIFKFTLPK